MEVSGPWVQSLIETYLGRQLFNASYTHESYQPRSTQIQLDNYPVESVTTITMDGNTKDVSQYHLTKATGQVYGDFSSVDVLTIVYDGGFSELPAIIESVYMAIMKDGYEELSDTSDADVKDVTIFDFAKVAYDTTGSSGNISYSGVSSGNVPEPLANYLGQLDFYKSNVVLASTDGVG